MRDRDDEIQVYDISVAVENGITVYPGDPEYRIRRVQRIPPDKMNVSLITLGVHTGTHVDVPLHVVKDGQAVSSISLRRFYGPCRVIDLSHIAFGEGINASDLMHAGIGEKEIVLFKTKNSFIPRTLFRSDYIYLTPEGAEYLIRRKISTVGIDYLSIDKLDEDRVHHILLEKSVPIFENLDLRKVSSGQYFFAGGPIKLVDSDGAPARAVLIKGI
ncbi:MAG: cyclase family protein [Candidatus Ranarchaeia archaeon]